MINLPVTGPIKNITCQIKHKQYRIRFSLTRFNVKLEKNSFFTPFTLDFEVFE